VVTVRLSIEPRLLGAVSVGTVGVIKLVQLHAGLGLIEAKRLVDRCVFDGESVAVVMPSLEFAESFIRAVSSEPVKVQATIESQA